MSLALTALSATDTGVRWPVFSNRYAPVLAESSVPYVETLVVVLLGMLFLSAMLYLFAPGLGYSKLMTTLTLHRGDNAKGRGEGTRRLPVIFILVQGGVLLSILAEAFYTSATGDVADGVWQYWVRIGGGFGGAVILYTLSCLLYTWIGRLFATPDERKVWAVSYHALTCVWSLSLFVPVLMLTLGDVSPIATFVTLGTIYILYRIALVIRTLQIFGLAFFHPLHLFLYLCGREIVPLLFAGNFFY